MPRRRFPESALELYRLIAANRPVIFTDIVAEWPALSRWTNEYLRRKLHGLECTVAVTPDGYADAVKMVDGGVSIGRVTCSLPLTLLFPNPPPFTHSISRRKDIYAAIRRADSLSRAVGHLGAEEDKDEFDANEDGRWWA